MASASKENGLEEATSNAHDISDASSASRGQGGALEQELASQEKVPESQDASQSAPPPRKVTGIAWLLVVAAMLSTIFLFALDNTVAADVQPQIVDEFNAVDRLAWISVAYLLGSCTLNFFW
jgi:hypothetical protein